MIAVFCFASTAHEDKRFLLDPRSLGMTEEKRLAMGMREEMVQASRWCFISFPKSFTRKKLLSQDAWVYCILLMEEILQQLAGSSYHPLLKVLYF